MARLLKRSDAMQSFHHEIASFADNCEESCADAIRCVREVQRIAKTVVSDAIVHLFGSQAAGLALSDSDIDIVVLSSSLPDVRANPSSKHVIVQFMQRMAEAIDSIEPSPIIHIEQMITKAAVPILKCITNSGRKCDLSFGVEGGLRAASLMKIEVQNCPAIRPVLLVLKQLLREQDLNEVYRGGISSYGLFHMVLSYFSTRQQPPDKACSEDHDADRVVRVTDGSFPYFRKLSAEEASVCTQACDSNSASRDEASGTVGRYGGVCLGQALLDVLERYGSGFDAVRLAVHGRRGLIAKSATRLEADRRDVGKARVAVVDLLDPAHDVTSGSFNTPLVLAAFTAARRALEAGLRDACAHRRSSVLGAALACGIGGDVDKKGGKKRQGPGGPPLDADGGGTSRGAAGHGGVAGKRGRFEESDGDGPGGPTRLSFPDIQPSPARRPRPV